MDMLLMGLCMTFIGVAVTSYGVRCGHASKVLGSSGPA